MTKLILVRHGETRWNAQQKMQGRTDIPLSLKGKLQARRLKKRFQDQEIDAIYSSQLMRAFMTAQEVAKEHPLKVIKDARLNEVSYGIWEGLVYEDIKKNQKDRVAERNKDKFNYAPPKGESPANLQKRLKSFLKDILKKHKEETVLLICHNGVKRMLLGTILGWSKDKIMTTRLNNTSVSILYFSSKTKKMRLFNCTKHLEM